jgi:ribosomal protein L7Ae-like RNA K-turn-binding protein
MAGRISEESRSPAEKKCRQAMISKKKLFSKPEEAEADPNEKIMTLLQFARKAGKLVHGFEACKKDVFSGKLKLLLTTTDIAKNTKDKIMSVIKLAESSCPVHEFSTQPELSAALGLPFTGIIGILDNNFAQKILSYIVH